MQRVALLLTHAYKQCTILTQKTSWASVSVPMIGVVQLHRKPLSVAEHARYVSPTWRLLAVCQVRCPAV